MSGRRRKKRNGRGDHAWWEAPWLAGVVLVAFLVVALRRHYPKKTDAAQSSAPAPPTLAGRR